MLMLTGALLGWAQKLLVMGIAFVEAFILMWSFDHIASKWDVYFYQLEWSLPVTEIAYWDAFWFIIFLHIVGELVVKITPKFVSIDNSKS